MTLFDDGTGPIRDLAWLDPTGELRAEWERHLAWKREHGIAERRHLPSPGLAPVSIRFTEAGRVEHCSIPGFAMFLARISDARFSECQRAASTAWALGMAIARGLRTPYTDTFRTWDRPALARAEGSP